MKKIKIDEFLKKIAEEFDADSVTMTIFVKKNKKAKNSKVFAYFKENIKDFKK